MTSKEMDNHNHQGLNDPSDGNLYDPLILKGLEFSSLPRSVRFDPPLTLSNPGDSLVVRPLNKNDFSKGFPQVLTGLTKVGDVTKEQFIETFDKMLGCPNTYFVTVIEDTRVGKIIGSATLLVEQKFIHNCALRARVEDVVVNDEYRGKQLGKLLLGTMILLSKQLGCYKLSLDCKDKMVAFYETFGFVKEAGQSNFMTIRF